MLEEIKLIIIQNLSNCLIVVDNLNSKKKRGNLQMTTKYYTSFDFLNQIIFSYTQAKQG